MTKISISPIEDVQEIEEAPIDEESESSPIEIVPVKPKRTRKKQETPPPPPPTPEEAQPIKKGKVISCNICGKELLEKTFKYYHQLKCKPKEQVQQQPVPVPEPIRPETFVANFDFPRRMARSEKYVSLISKAF
jgi:hypothetical protein